MANINFGIDLGTTNSGIGHFADGKVAILKNPVGFQETLPSVVAFKGSRTLVGSKAQELLMSRPENVFSSFKRKMGTDEKFFIEENSEFISPTQLSALVLKELKTFSISETFSSAVITIPASFDTVQSNATKTAGENAGINEVVLLQEPIAACLAYSNENDLKVENNQKWIVYDYGGGTFDAAIVHVNERELKVIDHKGNNFLGGVDLDLEIMRKLVIPKIELASGLQNIWTQINELSNKVYNKFAKYLIYLCEQLKKELSLKESAWIEIDFDELGINLEFEIERSDFDKLVAPLYQESFNLVDELMKENKLDSTDIDRIIMVGGTTFIPYIRQKLENDTKIQIDTSIDPTTAIIKGAAYYSGTKVSKEIIQEKESQAEVLTDEIKIQLSFERMTKDSEELIAFKTEGPFKGSYRLQRLDGGYDSGVTSFSQHANEFVALLQKNTNNFKLSIFDESSKLVYSNSEISITHGFYNVNGQPLPNDICIELDSEDETYLELIFKKNTILPLKKTLYKTFSQSIAKGSDDKITINIVEGKIGTMPGANMNIGYIELSGRQLKDDLIKGTDIELTFEISESRDLKVEIFIPSADQEIIETFNPNFKGNLSNQKIIDEINRGIQSLNTFIAENEQSENYEALAKLVKYKSDLEDIKDQLTSHKEDSFTDNKYQMQDKKRQILLEIDRINLLDDISEVIEEYKFYKESLLSKEEGLDPNLRTELRNTIKNESQFLQSNDKYLIKRKIKALSKISDQYYFQQDDSYFSIFIRLKHVDSSEFNDYKKVQRYISEGEKAYDKNEAAKLKSICMIIFGELKNDRSNENKFNGTGLR